MLGVKAPLPSLTIAYNSTRLITTDHFIAFKAKLGEQFLPEVPDNKNSSCHSLDNSSLSNQTLTLLQKTRFLSSSALYGPLHPLIL